MTQTTTTTPNKTTSSIWTTPDALPDTALTPTGVISAVRRGIKEEIFPLVPDTLIHADEAHDRINAAQSRYFADNVSGEQLVNASVERILAGEDLGEDFLTQVHEWIWSTRERDEGAALLNAMRANLEWRTPRILSDATGLMLDALRSDLDQLLARVREIGSVLDGLDVTSPLAVAQASEEQRALFAEFPELVARYWQIRNAQKVLTVAGNQRPPGNTDSTTRWSWPEYLADRPVWEVRDGAIVDDPDPTARLLRVARLSTVWLPSYEQLCDAYDDWWNVDPPTSVSAPLPALQPGQWVQHGRTAR